MGAAVVAGWRVRHEVGVTSTRSGATIARLFRAINTSSSRRIGHRRHRHLADITSIITARRHSVGRDHSHSRRSHTVARGDAAAAQWRRLWMAWPPCAQ